MKTARYFFAHIISAIIPFRKARRKVRAFLQGCSEFDKLQMQHNQLQQQHDWLVAWQQSQHNELQSQHNELQSQHNELQSQHNELQSQHNNEYTLAFTHTIVHAAYLHDGMDMCSLEYLTHYFSSLHTQDRESWTQAWLVTIAKSYTDGDKQFAEKMLRLYLAKFGRQHLTDFEAVCRLLVNIGMNSAETDEIVAVYDQIHKIRSEQRFESLIRNAKSIAIVGRSPILLGKNLGEEIDSHDIVIRFNNTGESDWGIGKYIKDYGKKINVSFLNRWRENTNAADILSVYKDFRAYWINPDVTAKIVQDFDNNIDVLDFGMKEQICAESQIEDPTGGAVAILWVKNILGSLKNVSIYAFAFQDPNMDLSHFDAPHLLAEHDMNIEIAMLRNIVGDYKNKKDVER